jgi:RimJ/RimL family protein N-acetyltransferase
MLAPRPVVLEGAHVRLEPLAPGHLDALCAVGLDEELWRWTISRATTRSGMQAWLHAALAAQAAGTQVPFAIVERSEDRVVGSTSYLNIAVADGRLEIGSTWVARAWQRTAVNTEAKVLLLRHAFQVLACERVEFKTDALNAQSRAALRRLGAVEEGVLRRHMRTSTGRLRDTVYFSILKAEWPAVRATLEAKLGGPAA